MFPGVVVSSEAFAIIAVLSCVGLLLLLLYSFCFVDALKTIWPKIKPKKVVIKQTIEVKPETKKEKFTSIFDNEGE